MHDTASLMERIRALPPERIAEVEDFVDFITQKARRRAALDRLLAIAPALEDTGAEPVTDAEVVAEIRDMRASRPAS
jgi:hypothetical protein